MARFLLAACLVVMMMLSGSRTAACIDGVVAEEWEEVIIGVDLGTTYSCVGVVKDGHVEILPNDQGNRLTPSYVAFTPDGERVIGELARKQLTSDPENTIFDTRRLIGRHFDDPMVQRDIKAFPFKVIDHDNRPQIMVTAGGQERLFTPEEIAAMVIDKMKQIAEDHLGQVVTGAVISVPAYFNDNQRQATREAGTMAGLNVKRIVNEPIVAAIAYGLEKLDAYGERNILVYDLGGSTFDVSLLIIDNGVFEVVATNGDTHLGGEDFDYRVVDHFIKLFHRKYGKDIRYSNRAVQTLRREVEKAKRSLATHHKVTIEIDSFFEGVDFSETLTRDEFEQLNMDLFLSTLAPIQKVLEDGEVAKEQIDDILLIGGSTRIPKVQQLVTDFFGGKEAVRGVEPDEAVAQGAGIQASVLSREKDSGDCCLCDFNPLTLGIESLGGIMVGVIPRLCFIPNRRSKIFSTAADNQSTVSIRIFAGERARAKDNHPLGHFELTGIPQAPRGVPQIEVTIEIDVNGIITVTADVDGSVAKNHVVVEDNLSYEDIEKMIDDAEEFLEEDQVWKELVEARNKLLGFVNSLKNHINSKLGDQLSDRDQASITVAVDELNNWLQQNKEADIDLLHVQRKQLEGVVHPIMNKLYAGVHSDMDKLYAGVHSDIDKLYAGVHSDMDKLYAGVHSDMDKLYAGGASIAEEQQLLLEGSVGNEISDTLSAYRRQERSQPV